jgi:hypothetical protein
MTLPLQLEFPAVHITHLSTANSPNLRKQGNSKTIEHKHN